MAPRVHFTRQTIMARTIRIVTWRSVLSRAASQPNPSIRSLPSRPSRSRHVDLRTAATTQHRPLPGDPSRASAGDAALEPAAVRSAAAASRSSGTRCSSRTASATRGSGARASRVALSALAHLAIRYGRWNVRVDADTISEITAQGAFLYRRVHDAMLEASRADPLLADMATSLTAMYIAGADLFFAHVGHSKGVSVSRRPARSSSRPITRSSSNGSTRSAARPSANAEADFTHVVTELVGGARRPRRRHRARRAVDRRSAAPVHERADGRGQPQRYRRRARAAAPAR